ncbi:hypothetical protein SAMN05660772_00914 [Pasteurella testudinis DSM 23072]|uniref:Uncharacterized protein n=1 Tax=Pasteurella testudinis DSM 23072 TaxID=1122938 RepID=A0A1W1UZV9_9PAST|nr:hypothetical protein [Pasteurella testudinis]SMB86618.1 hypothetical protein SAMN05660772_00914 [Pasteurella testudinis DSM 23072]SUB51833.1 Uncharacterised protein [Pasteurella testudinis]
MDVKKLILITLPLYLLGCEKDSSSIDISHIMGDWECIFKHQHGFSGGSKATLDFNFYKDYTFLFDLTFIKYDKNSAPNINILQKGGFFIENNNLFLDIKESTFTETKNRDLNEFAKDFITPEKVEYIIISLNEKHFSFSNNINPGTAKFDCTRR